jgi:hypothetical protein
MFTMSHHQAGAYFNRHAQHTAAVVASAVVLWYAMWQLYGRAVQAAAGLQSCRWCILLQQGWPARMLRS